MPRDVHKGMPVCKAASSVAADRPDSQVCFFDDLIDLPTIRQRNSVLADTSSLVGTGAGRRGSWIENLKQSSIKLRLPVVPVHLGSLSTEVTIFRHFLPVDSCYLRSVYLTSRLSP